MSAENSDSVLIIMAEQEHVSDPFKLGEPGPVGNGYTGRLMRHRINSRTTSWKDDARRISTRIMQATVHDSSRRKLEKQDLE